MGRRGRKWRVVDVPVHLVVGDHSQASRPRVLPILHYPQTALFVEVKVKRIAHLRFTEHELHFKIVWGLQLGQASLLDGNRLPQFAWSLVPQSPMNGIQKGKPKGRRLKILGMPKRGIENTITRGRLVRPRHGLELVHPIGSTHGQDLSRLRQRRDYVKRTARGNFLCRLQTLKNRMSLRRGFHPKPSLLLFAMVVRVIPANHLGVPFLPQSMSHRGRLSPQVKRMARRTDTHHRLARFHPHANRLHLGYLRCPTANTHKKQVRLGQSFFHSLQVVSFVAFAQCRHIGCPKPKWLQFRLEKSRHRLRRIVLLLRQEKGDVQLLCKGTKDKVQK